MLTNARPCNKNSNNNNPYLLTILSSVKHSAKHFYITSVLEGLVVVSPFWSGGSYDFVILRSLPMAHTLSKVNLTGEPRTCNTRVLYHSP